MPSNPSIPESAVEAAERPIVMQGGSHIEIPEGEDGPGAMVWPNPVRAGEISYRLRYGPELTRSEQLVAASALDAYHYLLVEPTLTQRIRNQRVKEIRSALEQANQREGR
jgi:hypothetical protein